MTQLARRVPMQRRLPSDLIGSVIVVARSIGTHETMRLRPYALLLALALPAACVRTRTDPVTGKMDVDIESPTKHGEDWSAKMTGAAGYTAAAGQAKARVINGQSTISVTVSGLTPGSIHPWGVFEGRCGTTGALFGSAGLYPPITVNDQGIAEAVARISMALDEAKKYHVRLYVSPSETATVAVCGDLSD